MGIKGTLVVSWFNIMCYTSKQVRLNLVFTDICKYTDISKYRDIILPTIPQCISLYILISVNILTSDLVAVNHSLGFCLFTNLNNVTSLYHIMLTMEGKQFKTLLREVCHGFCMHVGSYLHLGKGKES